MSHKVEIEIEFKNLLTETEYITLLNSLFESDEHAFTQQNIYFDTKDFVLKKHFCALRIRVKENFAEITLKTPFKGHHKELNITLTPSDAEEHIQKGSFILPVEVTTLLKGEGIDLSGTVYKTADLKTQRIEREYKECLLVLDKSWYAGLVDYELELESQTIETGQKVFDSILEQFSLPKRPTVNKITRAFKAISSN